jgi:hypothetical protein
MELKESDMELKKSESIVIEPALSLYWLDDAIVMSIPPAMPTEDDTSPLFEVFALEGMTRKHELERMVRVLWEVMDAMDTFNSKHERYNILIEIEDRDKEGSST